MRTEYADKESKLDVPDTCQIAGLEAIYNGIFQDIDDGFFVEVGAHDGQTYSNTWPLAVLGWQGIYIEPNKALYDRCVGNHKDHKWIKCINRAIGNHSGERMFYTDGSELFTINEHFAHILAPDIKEYGTLPISTLDEVLLHHTIQPYFELLVIDVEGAELEVLEGFSLYYYLPKMVIIETHKHHKVKEMRLYAEEIHVQFIIAGYVCIYSDAINNIYIRP